MDGLAIAGVVLAAVAGVVAAFWVLSLFINPKRLDIRGKVVVVTGGSSGIGLACAVEAAKRGASVVIIARKPAGLHTAKELVRPILEAGMEVHAISADVTDERSCSAAADEISDRFGRVHMLIMSAGISEPGEFVRTDVGTWDRVFAVNVRGCRNAVSQMLPLLTAAAAETPAGARVCFVSSAAGLTGVYGLSAYCASKFALLGLAQSLQQELLSLGVRVGLHFPPDTDTPLLHSENLRKPRLTKEISETIGVEQPEDVARTLVRHSADGLFLSAHDWISWALTLQTAGLSPAPTVGEAVAQTLLAGFPLRLVGVFLVADWIGTTRKRRATDVEPAVLGSPTAKRLADRAEAAGRAFPGPLARLIEAHQGAEAEAEAEMEEEAAAKGEVASAVEGSSPKSGGARRRASPAPRGAE